jgi:hypothetical protein
MSDEVVTGLPPTYLPKTIANPTENHFGIVFQTSSSVNIISQDPISVLPFMIHMALQKNLPFSFFPLCCFHKKD